MRKLQESPSVAARGNGMDAELAYHGMPRRAFPTVRNMLPDPWRVRLLSAIAIWLALATSAAAQNGPWHYLNKADMPPGVIGMRQLERGGPLAGYFQPVEVTAPAGTLLSVVANGDFSEPKPGKLLAGMLIGQVYRLKVSNIPGLEGQEVFPTIEVIDRLYPPPGQAARFPIPIELTAEELRYALDARYVLRVIYLEDVQSAPPVRDEPGKQRYFEIAPGEDAMQAADRLGRPMAILRMGSRVPLPDEDPGRFLYEQPPVFLFEPPPTIDRKKGLEAPLEAPLRMGRPSRNFERSR
jgi:hypothetical protein